MTMEKDIERRIHEKLRLWFKDSLALCEMADIDKPRALTVTTSALMMALIYILDHSNSDPEEAGNLMKVAMEIARQHRQERGKQKEAEA